MDVSSAFRIFAGSRGVARAAEGWRSLTRTKGVACGWKTVPPSAAFSSVRVMVVWNCLPFSFRDCFAIRFFSAGAFALFSSGNGSGGGGVLKGRNCATSSSRLLICIGDCC